MKCPLIAALTVALMLAACAPMTATRGNLVSDAKFGLIVQGVSTRADVEQQWGPPTNVSTLDPNTWYYIGETTEQKAVFEPEVTKRRLVRVKFDPTDRVIEVADIDPKLAESVKPVGRVTPTAGKEYTMFEQFIGNIGKFNPDAGKKRGGAGP